MKKSPANASEIKTQNPALGEIVARCEGMPRPFLLRLARAVELVELRLVLPCPVVPGDVLIKGSEAEPYRVSAGACDCADSTLRGHVCKHRLARRLYWALEAESARADKEAALSTPGAASSAARLVSSGAHAAGVREQEARAFAEARPEPVLDSSAAQLPAGDGDFSSWDDDSLSPSHARRRGSARVWLDMGATQGAFAE
jgi:hypothetical protein